MANQAGSDTGIVLEPRRAEFARKYIASTLGATTASGASAELLATAFSALSREEETRTAHRDTWGNWDWPFGSAHLDGLINTPFVDDALRRTLGVGDRAPRWPNGARFAVCLSHDVDDIARGLGARRALHSLRDQALGDGDVRSRLRRAYGIVGRTVLAPLLAESQRRLDQWLDAEADRGFRSTFFVVAPDLARPHPWDVHYAPGDVIMYRDKRARLIDFFREAVAGGWEIGLHGSFASATTPGLLLGERLQIERIVDRAVTSTRQHFLRFDISRTPQLQVAAGLSTDSTLGFNRGVGFRSGSAFPHLLWDWSGDKVLPLLEVPQHVMDGGLFTSNALEYDLELAVRHVIRLMDAVETVGGCLTLSWHPNGNPSWYDVYVTILDEAKHRGAWGCSVEQLDSFWRARLQSDQSDAG